MTRCVSIVMYHYVRDLEKSRYPEIKGLAIDLFKEQISYIQNHYHVVSAYDLMDAVQNGDDLPPNALLLTFDDAYSDHFNYVFPVLDSHGIPGCFFPTAKCIINRQVLDVNKIHFILASVPDKRLLVDEITRFVDGARASYDLAENNWYWDKVGMPSRYDPAEVMFIKRMLQRELPEELRNVLVDDLFKKHVTQDERAFSEELYMSVDQIAFLQGNGMYVGSHGYDHYWLDSLSPDKQIREVNLSLDFLKSVGSSSERWIMCYPNGGYNESLVNILAGSGCVVGLTTEVGIADLEIHSPLTLPRINTNDLPKKAGAIPNEWTNRALNSRT